MTYTSLFGQFTGRAEVAQAAIGTLQTWILYYLAEVERQDGLPAKSIVQPGGQLPPNATSYPADSPAFRSSIDFETWRGDVAPQIIVVAQPSGDAERIAAGQYQQWYELQVATVVESAELEADALTLADQYGKAITALLSAQGGLGTRLDWQTQQTVPFAEQTILIAAAKTEWANPAQRRVARSVVSLHTLVEQVVDASQGPRVPPGSPYTDPGGWETVQETSITLLAQDAAGNTSQRVSTVLSTTPPGP